MSWQSDYHKFSAFFSQFERDLQKKNLSKSDEKYLVDNLNQVVEWGWKALQNYNLEKSDPLNIAKTNLSSFSGNHALLRLKDMFENKIQVRSAHDVDYLKQNEWEIREVIHPAFRELKKFFQTLKKVEAAE